MLSKIDSQRFLQNATWFVSLRWYVILAALTGIILVKQFFDLELSYDKLYLVILFLLLVNISYYWFIKIKLKDERIININKVRLFLNIQVFIDLLLLTLILHFSGGIENPMIVFYIFHMILSGILLPRTDSFIQATAALILFISLILLESNQIITHYTINDHLSGLLESDVKYIATALGVFTVTSYMVVFLTSHVTSQLRRRESELEKLNRELNEKDTIKNEYVLRLTHDIKGYVSAVRSNLEVINRSIYGQFDERYIPFLKGSDQVLENLSLFIKDLLELTRSRLTGSREKLETDILTIIENAKKEVEIISREKKITLTINVEPELKKIPVDIVSMKELLVNVLGNAIKYSNENTEVKIEASRYNDRFVLVKISDQGVGIPENEIPMLFSEFFRASNVKKNYEGTGLGLAIVKQIALNHGGEVWIESEEGKGTIVYVTLPFGKEK